jgi:hypothetical protein
MPYHSKASPMILPNDRFDSWLSADQTILFDDILRPKITIGLKAIPIDKPSNHNTIAPTTLICAD